MQIFCNCNEKCFMFTCTLMSKDGVYQKIQKYKCNRLPIDGVKKQPCDFKKEIIIDEMVEYEKTSEINKCIVVPSEIVDKRINYREELNKLLKIYDFSGTNYFGKINFYMLRLGYYPHDPPNESRDQLFRRVYKPAIKQKNKIYVDKESMFSQTIGEYDYDLELEEAMYKRILSKENLFEYTEDPYIKELITIKRKNNFKPKNKSGKKNKTDKSTLALEDLEKKDLLDVGLEENKEQQEEQEEEDSEDENGSDDENDKDKDNEFDVENYSEDDEYEDVEYDDFSD